MLLASELIIPWKIGYDIYNQRKFYNTNSSKIKPILCKLELTLGRFEGLNFGLHKLHDKFHFEEMLIVWEPSIIFPIG